MKDQELYCEIGRVALAWSRIDCLFVFGIAHFSGIEYERAKCMFITSGSRQKLEALECLLGDVCARDTAFCQKMTELLVQIDRARLWRNELQHCQITLCKDGAQIEKSKKRLSKIEVSTKIYSREELVTKCKNVERLAKELEGLIQEAANTIQE